MSALLHVELLFSFHSSFCPCRVRLKGPRKVHMAGKRNLQRYLTFDFCLGSVVALPSPKSGWVPLFSPLDVALQSRGHEAALQILHCPPKAPEIQLLYKRRFFHINVALLTWLPRSLQCENNKHSCCKIHVLLKGSQGGSRSNLLTCLEVIIQPFS